MAWTLKIDERVEKDFLKINSTDQKRITQFLRSILANPRSKGGMLKGKLNHLWRYRVGDYRVLCELFDDVLLVSVVEVGHRKDIYR